MMIANNELAILLGVLAMLAGGYLVLQVVQEWRARRHEKCEPEEQRPRPRPDDPADWWKRGEPSRWMPELDSDGKPFEPSPLDGEED